jgi:hypothetical protein
MKKLVLLLLLFVSSQKILFAQDSLPIIRVVSINNNILISWNNPFTSLENINIQRSYDSTNNFQTIGTTWNVTNKTDGFVDRNPPTKAMYYRLFLTFEGGAYLFSDTHRPTTDTITTLPITFKPAETTSTFPASKYVYTGRDNNVVIALPAAGKKKYLIKFFEEDGTFMFDIHNITESFLILEKVNFSHPGLFNYELFEDGNLLEKYKFYIQRDPKKQ